MAEDERLTRLTEDLPGAPRSAARGDGGACELQGEEERFGYFVNDHHGDGIAFGVWCKVLPGENAALIAANPKRFYLPAYVGPRGWVDFGGWMWGGELEWKRGGVGRDELFVGGGEEG